MRIFFTQVNERRCFGKQIKWKKFILAAPNLFRHVDHKTRTLTVLMHLNWNPSSFDECHLYQNAQTHGKQQLVNKYIGYFCCYHYNYLTIQLTEIVHIR